MACSLGLATGRGEEVVFSTLVSAADAALYEAKRYGRNRVEQHVGIADVQPLVL